MYRYEEEDDRQGPGGFGGGDRDFYRKNFSNFSSVVNHFHNRLYIRSFKERRWLQPHYSSLIDITTPYSNVLNPADGICTHFLTRGFARPKTLFNCALWSPDARWLVLGTQNGDFILWESEALKVHKLISVPAHKQFAGDQIIQQIPITAMAWKHFGNLIATGDENGLIQYCDETFRNVSVTKEAHTRAIRGLSFSALDTKLASCRQVFTHFIDICVSYLFMLHIVMMLNSRFGQVVEINRK
jgi:WD40 repeat protein